MKAVFNGFLVQKYSTYTPVILHTSRQVSRQHIQNFKTAETYISNLKINPPKKTKLKTCALINSELQMRHTKYSLLKRQLLCLDPLKCCDTSTQPPSQGHCSYFLLSFLNLPIKWTGFTKNNHFSLGIRIVNALIAVIIFIRIRI